MARPTITRFLVLHRQQRRSNHCVLSRQAWIRGHISGADQNPFFAIIRRDGAQIFLKSDDEVTPLPNPRRHPSMRWDAFVFARIRML